MPLESQFDKVARVPPGLRNCSRLLIAWKSTIVRTTDGQIDLAATMELVSAKLDQEAKTLDLTDKTRLSELDALVKVRDALTKQAQRIEQETKKIMASKSTVRLELLVYRLVNIWPTLSILTILDCIILLDQTVSQVAFGNSAETGCYRGSVPRVAASREDQTEFAKDETIS